MIEDMYSEFAKKLQEEIDKEILEELLITMYESKGWIVVPYSENYAKIDGLWMQENIKHDWRLFVTSAVFENKEDAVLFTMRWGS